MLAPTTMAPTIHAIRPPDARSEDGRHHREEHADDAEQVAAPRRLRRRQAAQAEHEQYVGPI